MLAQLANRLAEYALKRNYIPDHELELYKYAYLMLFERVISWGAIFFVAVIYNCVLGALAFFLTFIPLRSYAGGFHAKNYIFCFLTSFLSFALMIYVYKVVCERVPMLFCWLALLSASIVIFVFAPVEDMNKPLNREEKNKYRKLSRCILAIAVTAIMFLCLVNTGDQIIFFATFAISLESVLVLGGLIKNRLVHNSEKEE